MEVVMMARLSEQEKREAWRLRNRGHSLREIARLMGRSNPEPVRLLISLAGGIAPRPRRRSPDALTLAEREEISRGIGAGESNRAIGERLGRDHSTVWREITRNGGRGCYRAGAAEQRAQERARRPKAAKLVTHPRLAAVVTEKLQQWWSPEEISGWLKRTYPGDLSMQISHEAIYQSLFVQARGALRKELTRYLRHKPTMRRPRRRLRTEQGQIPGKVMISERPAEAADRAVPGHWEGDLLMGGRNTAIATLVERHSRLAMLVGLPDGRGAEQVRIALTNTIQRLPEQLWRSLTWDQGQEMSQHAQFTIDSGIQIYFCDPHSPWQRGTNENTNGLLRQFLPKGSDLSGLTQSDLDQIAELLNSRPRKTLGFMTPAEALHKALADSDSPT